MWTGKKGDKYIYAIEQLIFFSVKTVCMGTGDLQPVSIQVTSRLFPYF